MSWRALVTLCALGMLFAFGAFLGGLAGGWLALRLFNAGW